MCGGGAELVGGQGEAAPQFMFAQLYRARIWDGEQAQEYLSGGQVLSRFDSSGDAV